VQICSVSVEGFRCLEDIPEVPVLSQTVLTGQNEGGKTALLDALNFLLHGTALSKHDLTYVGDGALQDPAGDAATAHARVPQAVVTGSFSLSAEERLRLGLPRAGTNPAAFPAGGRHVPGDQSPCLPGPSTA
jgi:putative ATP-dependent endonuclease of the OLD family